MAKPSKTGNGSVVVHLTENGPTFRFMGSVNGKLETVYDQLDRIQRSWMQGCSPDGTFTPEAVRGLVQDLKGCWVVIAYILSTACDQLRRTNNLEIADQLRKQIGVELTVVEPAV